MQFDLFRWAGRVELQIPYHALRRGSRLAGILIYVEVVIGWAEVLKLRRQWRKELAGSSGQLSGKATYQELTTRWNHRCSALRHIHGLGYDSPHVETPVKRDVHRLASLFHTYRCGLWAT